MAQQVQQAVPDPRTGGRERPWSGKGLRRERWLGYLFITPMMLFLVGIIFFPLGHAFKTSLYREAGVNVRYVGLGNYTRLLENDQFWNSLKVTGTYTVASVTIHVLVAMPLAMFLNRLKRGRTTLRLVLLTPWMVAPVIGAIAWVWILDPHFGALNHLLTLVGVISENKVWLGEPRLALGAITAVDVWRGFPFVMLIMLAGLQSIPKEQYEAASIDGAGPLSQFRYVTLPNLRYLLAVAVTLDVISTVKTFDTVAVMTKGGPINATEILPMLIYNTAFREMLFGPAAAVGVVLLLLLLVFSVIYIALIQPGKSAEEG